MQGTRLKARPPQSNSVVAVSQWGWLAEIAKKIEVNHLQGDAAHEFGTYI